MTPTLLLLACLGCIDVPPDVPNPPPQAPAMAIQLRAYGAIITMVSETGVLGGVGASMHMKDHDKIELMGDASFGRLYGSALFAVTAGAVYHLDLPNSTFKPYIGGGLGYAHVSAGVFKPNLFGPQAIAGVKLPMSGRYEIRVEARTFLFFSHPLVIGASVTF